MKILIISALFVAATAVAVACPVAEKQMTAKSSPVVQSPGKGTAGIAVDYRLQGKAAVGAPLQLELSIAARDALVLAVDVNAPAELGFAAGRVQRDIASGETLSLTLVPQTQGRFYVNVLARNPGNGLARAVSIPVQVGVTARKASRAVATPDGELIVRLPAAE